MIDPAGGRIREQPRFRDVRKAVRQGEQLGHAVVAQQRLADLDGSCAADADAGTSIAAAGHAGQLDVAGTVEGTDAVALGSLHDQAGDRHAIDVIERDARLPAGARGGHSREAASSPRRRSRSARPPGTTGRPAAALGWHWPSQWHARPPRRRLPVQIQLLVAGQTWLKAKHRALIRFPSLGLNRQGAVEDRPVAVDRKRLRSAAVAAADQAEALVVGPAMGGQHQRVAGLGQRQGLADRAGRSGQVARPFRVLSAGPVVPGAAIDEDITAPPPAPTTVSINRCSKPSA